MAALPRDHSLCYSSAALPRANDGPVDSSISEPDMTTLAIQPDDEKNQQTANSTDQGPDAVGVAHGDQPRPDAPRQERESPGYWPVPGERVYRDTVWVEVYSRASLPTRFGEFRVFVFRNSVDDKEHVALVRGEIRGHDDVAVRVHSECLTGDVLASLRCDCRNQLERTLQELGQAERGVLVYMRQEGRGIGLGNKIRAYALQEQGLDTFEANQHLGFDDDLRRYDVAGLILQLFGIRSIRLFTNNPRKVFGLRAVGVNVLARESVVTDANPHNVDYLTTKARSGHFLPFGE